MKSTTSDPLLSCWQPPLQRNGHSSTAATGKLLEVIERNVFFARSPQQKPKHNLQYKFKDQLAIFFFLAKSNLKALKANSGLYSIGFTLEGSAFRGYASEHNMGFISYINLLLIYCKAHTATDRFSEMQGEHHSGGSEVVGIGVVAE